MITITTSLGMYSVGHFGILLFERKGDKNRKMNTHEYTNRVDIVNISICYIDDNHKFDGHRCAIFCYNSLWRKPNWFTQLIEKDLSTY